METTSNDNIDPLHEPLLEAFKRKFNCTGEGLECKFNGLGSILVKFSDDIYEVAVEEYLRYRISKDLEDPEMARSIPPYIWAKATRKVHTRSDFYIKLLELFDYNDSLEILNLAVSATALADDKKKTFWHTLARINDHQGCVYGKAIVAAATVQNAETLANRLLQLKIDYGHEIYNELRDGVFVSVKGTWDSNEDAKIFIFSRDYVVWESE